MADKVYNVTVTGGAPLAGYDTNISTLIRDRLPNQIIQEGVPRILISKYPMDIDSRYGSVTEKLKQLWDGQGGKYVARSNSFDKDGIDLDLVLHLGMDRGRAHYTLDTRARRDGYERPGQDGLYLQLSIFDDMPEELESVFQAESIVERLKAKLPDSVVVETSPDAGRFFCGFQLFSSLTELHRRDELKRVAFFHIPAAMDEESLEKGLRAVLAVIIELITDVQNHSY